MEQKHSEELNTAQASLLFLIQVSIYDPAFPISVHCVLWYINT